MGGATTTTAAAAASRERESRSYVRAINDGVGGNDYDDVVVLCVFVFMYVVTTAIIMEKKVSAFERTRAGGDWVGGQ